MTEPRIDHIHVTVRDIERAERFYDALLPLLGFDLALKEHDAVRRLPARILHAPRYWPEYCADYYAFFFKDSEGIEYEVASFARDVHFPA